MLKLKNKIGEKFIYTGLSEEKTVELASLITQGLSSQSSVLLAIVGNKGVGKSILGKYFRNCGIGPIHRRKIAVIDDDNMAVDTLYFFRRWYPNRCTGVDELAPFMKYCKKKPVRIYIKSNPESRISRADIVLRLSTEEKNRRRHLLIRDGEEKGQRMIAKTQAYPQEIKIDHDHFMEARV